MASSTGNTPYLLWASRAENVFRKPTCAFSAPMASIEAAKLVPTSSLKARPVIWPRQSAIAPPALAILPVSPEGTKVMTIGLSEAPSCPAAGASGASANLSQTGGGGGVGVGGATVAAVVGASVGASVAGTACVGAGASVGVGAGAQAASASDSATVSASRTKVRRLNIEISSHNIWVGLHGRMPIFQYLIITPFQSFGKQTGLKSAIEVGAHLIRPLRGSP